MIPRADDPAWRRVTAAYRLFGLEPMLDAEVTPYGFVYANGVAALGSDDDPGVALHDLAHFLTAAKRRQRTPNFGMGEHPQVYEVGRAPLWLEWFSNVAEEAAATILNVSMSRALFGDDATRACAGYLSCGLDGRICPRRVAVPRGYRRSEYTFSDVEMHRWFIRYGMPRWSSRGIRVIQGGAAGDGIYLDDASVREILRPIL